MTQDQCVEQAIPRILRTAARAVSRLFAAGGAGVVLWGCMFGDEVGEPATKGLDQFVYENCIPAECLYECCQGWNYSNWPSLVGGNAQRCSAFMTNTEYAQYDFLMSQDYNFCDVDLQYLEGGLCTPVRPADVFKKSEPDGKLGYAGLSFITCAPRGETAAKPLEGVTLVPKP